MITIKEFLEAAQYRIIGGSAFQWPCFGENARYLDCDGDNNESSASIVFDTQTQEVYLAEAWDYKRERFYRYFGSEEFKEAYQAESESRCCSFDEPYDNQRFTDLNFKEDFLAKLAAIVADEEYADTVEVELDLTDDEWLLLMQEAHKKDITLNQLVTQLLTEMVERESQKKSELQ